MKKILENEKFDWLFSFFEKKFISWFISIIIIIIVLLKTLTFFNLGDMNDTFNQIDKFISISLPDIFKEKDSTLISLAAIFIGLYFTTFTLMSTISTKSSFGLLEKDQFADLVNYIGNAFIASFLYLIVSLISPVLIKTGWCFSVISLLLLLYMLLSALRFGFLIYMILMRDIHRHMQDIELEQNKKLEEDSIMKELKEFLDKQKQKNNNKQADEISKMLEKRKEDKRR